MTSKFNIELGNDINYIRQAIENYQNSHKENKKQKTSTESTADFAGRFNFVIIQFKNFFN